MKRALISLLAVFLLFSFTGTAAAAYIDYLAGAMDDFALAEDASSPSTELVTVVGNNTNHMLSTQLQTFQDFDLIAGVNGGTNNTAVGHTFLNLPTGITGATLEFRVQAGDNPYVPNDQILLSFVENITDNWLDTLVWYRPFGPRNYNNSTNTGILYSDPGMLASWDIGDVYTFTLDLANLPLYDGGFYNLLPDLNYYGFLDVVIEDETGVDYMLLSIQTVPIPSGMILLGSGLVCILGINRRRLKIG